ncbi:Uma2 family endonuclease [Calothrix sp. FACHB-1219]|uniref:Uma2 family endonuclease n=1 Tax=unclassified Calothrix TaxID=2619626 RepID=UPI001687FA07|nr:MULTISPECIES: Uma2 family endonuclease [unclassified Calothrix]MBD2206916.1 Uma2 family endonuclease [Calothrix sp. FACHB-168]MBD2221534.1 Uma2 family endonuclease [Calothrix sp. FACHB-1219]
MKNIGLKSGHIIVTVSTTLEEFLKLPYIEESPAWEYINGEAIQKPMGGAKHSLLQKRLVSVIDSLDSNYEAFPELRCTFGNRSVVPDVVVISSNHLPLDENGEIISSGIDFAPAWVIEILSPAQSQTKVTGNILHCLRNGSQLGWLIDPSERCILVYQPNSLPDLLTGKDILPVLTNLNLKLSVDDVFAWLQRKI